MHSLPSTEIDDDWVLDVASGCVSPVVVGIMCGKIKRPVMAFISLFVTIYLLQLVS